jgi:hypothetical protein
MRARILPLRNLGRRLPENEIHGLPGLLGELQTAQIHQGNSSYGVAHLMDPESPIPSPLLPDLFEPTLVFIGPQALLLRGYEKVDGRAVMQEWRCELLA